VGRGFGPGPGGRPAAKEKTASSAAALAARIISMGALAVKEKLASGPKTSLAVDRLLAVAHLAADLQEENSAANDELAEGPYHDGETGLFYNWNRYYDPKLGRYITSDPISVGTHVRRAHARLRERLGSLGQPPLELSTYAYVADNPLRWTDPTGEVAIVVPIVEGIGAICARFPTACANAARAIGAGIGTGIEYVCRTGAQDKPDCAQAKRECIEECAPELGKPGSYYTDCIAKCMDRKGCDQYNQDWKT
jgi:RHS repeat-associated protein